MPNEADTCRQFVVPRLQATGWDNEPCQIREQVTFTDGRIVVVGRKGVRRPGKRVDYLLRYRPDFAIAVVEAKASYKSAADGLQQAKDYAELLGLKFAYATNGQEIIEFDYLTGKERRLTEFPAPATLWDRLSTGERIAPDVGERLLAPTYSLTGKTLRYYQEIAVNRTVQSLVQGKRRILLTMATGTGKTLVAFQICWKLREARWSRTGEDRRPRILYLFDRNILIDDPKDKVFAPFGDARWKIEDGVTTQGREMYFAIYQAIARDERRPGLYREYAPDFFDLAALALDFGVSLEVMAIRLSTLGLISEGDKDRVRREPAFQSVWRAATEVAGTRQLCRLRIALSRWFGRPTSGARLVVPRPLNASKFR